MSAAPQHDGVWERRVAAAVHAAYAEADLRLEALQLDLLEPRGDGTRWTAQQVRLRRATGVPRDMLGHVGNVLDAIGTRVVDVVNAMTGLSGALTGTTRDDYTLAGPADGAAS